MITIETVAKTLKAANHIAVFCHIRPDGDAVGASLAVKGILESLGKSVSLFCADPVPEKFACAGDLSAFSAENGDFSAFDLFLALDCADEARIGSFSYLFGKKKNTVLVDHHVSNTRYAALSYVEDVAATCQIVYKLAVAMGVPVTKKIADALFVGLSTDTGHFAHQNVTAETFSVASALTLAGADPHRVSQEMFKRQSAIRAKLYAEVMGKMRFYEGGKIALISVSKEQMERYGASQDMTEGFIDFPLSVDGVEIAVSMMQVAKQSFKVSFRSKGKADVNALAATFGGGGHVLASGCMVNGFFEDVEEKLVFRAAPYVETEA